MWQWESAFCQLPWSASFLPKQCSQKRWISRTFQKSSLEVSFWQEVVPSGKEKLILWLMKETWICSRNILFPGKEEVLRRKVIYITHMTAVAGWKNLRISTGQGHRLFRTESTFQGLTLARAAFQGIYLSLRCRTCSQGAEEQTLGWCYWLFHTLWMVQGLLHSLEPSLAKDSLRKNFRAAVLNRGLVLTARAVLSEHSVVVGGDIVLPLDYIYM